MIWFSSPEQWKIVEQELANGARGLQKLLDSVGNRLFRLGSSPPIFSEDQIAAEYSVLPSSASDGTEQKRSVGLAWKLSIQSTGNGDGTTFASSGVQRTKPFRIKIATDDESQEGVESGGCLLMDEMMNGACREKIA
ncbi:hypothetical protein R1sor_014620 [Riccia sorocarpa]|uniref:Uncharacterized protein n=1 Tax=Riccia sorocarpa TaxID=122646 RepID=A0ABD3HBR1_9MARC